jgi:orotidine-5'-phosphate decarboxylase
MNESVGLLINSSRGIIYASQNEGFAEAAAEKAKDLQEQMELILNS